MNEKLNKSLPCKIDCRNEENFHKVLEILDKEGFSWFYNESFKAIKPIKSFIPTNGRYVFITTNKIIAYLDKHDKNTFYSYHYEEISLEQFFSFFKPSKSQKLLNLEKDIKTKLKRMDWDGK